MHLLKKIKTIKKAIKDIKEDIIKLEKPATPKPKPA